MRAVVIVALLASTAAADRAHIRIRATDAAISQLARAGACASKTPRWWCAVAHWDRGTAAPLPFDKLLVGRWVLVGEPGLKQRRVGKVDERDELVGCVITGTPDQPLIKLKTFDGGDLSTIDRVLTHSAATAKLADSDAQSVRTLSGELPLIAVDDEWFWDDRSDDMRLRNVDGVWVVVLSPPPAAARAYPDARSVYVLTDAWE